VTDRKAAAALPGKVRLEFGIAGGLVAACVMSIGVMILSGLNGVGLNLITFAWFPMFGEIFGAPGLTSEAAMYGLLVSLVFGILWGAIFAFAFSKYTVMKGLGIAAIEFLVILMALSFVSTAEIGGTLLSLSLFDALPIMLGLAAALFIWGAAMGYIGKHYVPT
jgi:hypothetical protein